MGITDTFLPSSPFFTGAGVSSDVPGVLPVSIGGHAYLVDLLQYERQTVDVLRPAVDQFPEGGDQSLATAGVWRRTIANWRMGAGQTYLDTEQSDRTMFRESKGVDVWTRDRLSLLPDVAVRKSSANTNLKLLAAGAYLYVVDGTQMYHTTDPTGVSPTWTSSGTGSGIASITSDGAKVYAARAASGIYSTTLGAGSASSFCATASTLVGYANGRLLSGNGPILYEVSAAGTATTIFTHNNSSASFVAITGAPTGIFVGLNNGDHGEFFFVGFNASTGALATPVSAGQLPLGETIFSMVQYQGFVLLGTSRGLRLAQIVQDKGLAAGPVIEAPGIVRDFASQGEFVWFTWTNPDTESSGIGRLDLSRFTEPLVPAYASDLMAGIVGATVQGNSLSVACFGGKRYFAVSASGIYGQATTLAPSGTIESGQLRFATFEQKIAVSVDLRHEPLNGTVAASLTLEDETVINCGTSSLATSLQSPTLTANDATSEAIEITLTLTRSSGDTTKGPVLRRWSLRALPVPVRTDSILVPIIMRSVVGGGPGEGQEIRYDTLNEFTFLKGLEASRQPFTYVEGDLAQTVVVDQVAVKPARWADKQRWFEGTIFVRLLTVRPTQEA